MKQLLCALVFCFLLTHGFGQKKTDYVLKFDTAYEAKKIPVSFSAVKIVDARFDQSKIGCAYTKPGNLLNRFQKNDLVFPDSLNKYLPYLFNSEFAYSFSSDDTLLVLIKKFRLSEHLLNLARGSVEDELLLNISASFYSYQKGSLKKLFSVDDVWVQNGRSQNAEGPGLFKETLMAGMLRSMFSKLFRTSNWNLASQGMPFTMRDMEAGLQKRFDLPVFKQTPPVGLYKTFAEFKNASPSVKEISIVYNGSEIEKVIQQNSTLLNMEDYWGLFDGKKYYYFFRGRMNEMLPCDRSFRILSFRTKAELRGKTTGTEISEGNLFKGITDGVKVTEYFDLDMETGDLFLEEIFGKSGLKTMQRELLR